MERNGEAYVLSGARQLLSAWRGSEYLSKLIAEIENALQEKSDKALDGAKCLVEAVCKTILTERGITHGNADSLAKLIKSALNCLGIADTGEGEQVRNLCSGLITSVDGITGLRNSSGTLGHGRDAYHYPLGDWHRIMAVQASETIVVLLYEMYAGHPTNVLHTRRPFKASEIDTRIDKSILIEIDEETNDVIFDDAYRFRPSEILYALDRQGYIDAFNTVFSVDWKDEEVEVVGEVDL